MEVGGDVAFGDNEGVSCGDGVAVVDAEGERVF